ncbi:MAG: hypothetical protein M3Q45_03825 [Chloroflexota bacterium]|nr:hypothetical protein [Chloroflexota bacterium]
MAVKKSQKIEMQNLNNLERTVRVDADKYEAMKGAFLKILPATAPGLTAAEVLAGVLPHLPEDLFPQGATAGWWMKGVQLDLEAKDIIVRENTKPLRWHMR